MYGYIQYLPVIKHEPDISKLRVACGQGCKHKRGIIGCIVITYTVGICARAINIISQTIDMHRAAQQTTIASMELE